MAFTAGQKLTAAMLAAFGSRGSTLTNTTPSAASTYQQWGTQTLSFPNPGVPVRVNADVTGYIQNTANTDTNGIPRVGISFDNGVTWTYGNTPGMNVGTSVGTRGTVTASASLSGTPSNTVLVRAEVSVSTTNISALNGWLNAVMLPL